MADKLKHRFIARRVRDHLAGLDDLRGAEITKTAAALGLTNYTLYYRLSLHGCNHKDMLAEERAFRADQLLRANPGACVWDIADAVGYTCKNSVSDAFIKWFGIGIRDYRAKCKAWNR